MTFYDKCKKRYIEEVIHEYKDRKLITSSGRVVRNRKQAIAIALSMAQRRCKLKNNSLKQVEKKVLRFLVDDDRKISLERIPLTNVIETRILIRNLIDDGKKAKAKKYSKLLEKRIKKAEKKGILVTDNINKELRRVSRMFE